MPPMLPAVVLTLAALPVALGSLFTVQGLRPSGDAVNPLRIALLPDLDPDTTHALFPTVFAFVDGGRQVPVGQPFSLAPGNHSLAMTAVAAASGVVHEETVRVVVEGDGPVLPGSGVQDCRHALGGGMDTHVVAVWSHVGLQAVQDAAAVVEAAPGVVLDDVWILSPLDVETLHPFRLAGWHHRPHHDARHVDTPPGERGAVGSSPRPWRVTHPLEAWMRSKPLRLDGTVPEPSGVHVVGSLQEAWFKGFGAVPPPSHAGRRPFFLMLVRAPRRSSCTALDGLGSVLPDASDAMVGIQRSLSAFMLPTGFHVTVGAGDGERAAAFALGRFHSCQPPHGCFSCAMQRATGAPGVGCTRVHRDIWLGGALREVAVGYVGVVGGMPVTAVPADSQLLLADMLAPMFGTQLFLPKGDTSGMFVRSTHVAEDTSNTAMPWSRQPTDYERWQTVGMYTLKRGAITVDLPEDVVWMQLLVPLSHVLSMGAPLRNLEWLFDMVPAPWNHCISSMDAGRLWPSKPPTEAQLLRRRIENSMEYWLDDLARRHRIISGIADNATNVALSFVGLAKDIHSPFTLLDGTHRSVGLAVAAHRNGGGLGGPDPSSPCAQDISHPACVAKLTLGISSTLDCRRRDAGMVQTLPQRCFKGWCRALD